MKVDAVAASVRRRDLGDGAVGGAGARGRRSDAHDRARRKRFRRLAASDVDIVDAAVGGVDDQVVTIVEFVGQAALDHPSDDRLHRGRIGDHRVQTRTFDAMGCEGALHRADDVAAFAHTPQGLLAVRRKRPAPCPQLARQAETAERLQPASPQGLLERIALERHDDAPGVEVAKEPPVEAR
ncbi:hypothetical protein BDIM_15580 [Brevundimonas diminuta ATCC 11568]|nr:hypothetical protein BDIM_15580 [Brevundimonas diminuta ATCC 11568]